MTASPVLGQRYVDSTMIVETRWADVTVTDYLEPAPEGITSLVGDQETLIVELDDVRHNIRH